MRTPRAMVALTVQNKAAWGLIFQEILQGLALEAQQESAIQR
jgi:hypothetical protein